ncbi:MAG TPA: ABC transporter substrate-binding protein [Gemmataceae bacterium]|nr:ABC transporter substrate-binding protein [Gemmataceae bacterium]
MMPSWTRQAPIARRTLLAGTGAMLLATPLAAEAQQPGKLSRIGVLMNLYPPDAGPPQALRQRLRDLGYIEGHNLVIDWRYQLGGGDRLPALAVELVRLKPDVIVADATGAVRAAMQATSSIPIVMASSADAVGTGLVPNLGHPGGNVTGVTIMLQEMSAKRLQLLKEAVPNVSRVAVLWDPALPWHPAMLKEVEAAASSLRLQPIAIAVRGRGDFGNAFAEITNARVEALFVSETMTPTARKQIVDFAAKNRQPTMFMNRDYVAAGGLMSYAPDFSEAFRRAATYVEKILKGAKPGDLPVEQPTKFEFVINLKTAKALGLTIPPPLLTRADEVIQ